jgi:DNA-binding transcriptional MerR regulator
MDTQERTFTIEDLCSLSGLPIRTIRYYVQRGLIPSPHGVKRGAWYDHNHLERLLSIRRWQQAGISLERITELLSDEVSDKPLPPPKQAGSLEVKSHLYLDDGLEIVIDPARSRLTPENVRRFFSEASDLLKNIRAESEQP